MDRSLMEMIACMGRAALRRDVGKVADGRDYVGESYAHCHPPDWPVFESFAKTVRGAVVVTGPRHAVEPDCIDHALPKY